MTSKLAASAAVVAAALALLAIGAAAETVQRGNLRISVEGGLQPRKLPREGTAPVAVEIAGRISTVDGRQPPQLRRIELAINRFGRIDGAGLPTCSIDQIQPSTTGDALRICGRAMVGEGRFSANVVLPEQSPFPSRGRVLAFNGAYRGKPAVLAHVFGNEPVPTSYVLPFQITEGKGTFATVLTAALPQVASDWGFVTGLSMKLSRSYREDGERRGFVSAGCPAPKGFPGAVFPLVRAKFSFAGGSALQKTLTRTCGVRR